MTFVKALTGMEPAIRQKSALTKEDHLPAIVRKDLEFAVSVSTSFSVA